MRDSELRQEPMGTVSAITGRPNCGGPQWYTRVLLTAFSLGLCNRLYAQYSLMDRLQPAYWMTFLAGKGSAPEQYRIGVKMAAWWMVEHFGWGFRHGFLAMDVLSSLTAVFLLYSLLESRVNLRVATHPVQWFASAAFLALLFFYMAWVESYFRPETLPTAALTIVLVWLWTGCNTDATTMAQRVYFSLGLVAVTAFQAFIRADVPVALNLGMALAYLAAPKQKKLDRFWKLAVALLAVIVAGAIQLYLMRVRYPDATYGSVHVLMIRYSLRRFTNYPPFLCFMVPVVWTVVYFWRSRLWRAGRMTDNGLIIASLIYLSLWVVLGKLNEVRIFLPFALAMAPLTVDLALDHVGRLPGEKARMVSNYAMAFREDEA